MAWGMCGRGWSCATEAQLQDERIKVLQLERQVDGRSAVGSANPDKVRAVSRMALVGVNGSSGCAETAETGCMVCSASPCLW
jgi:hypothetical protein